MAMDVCYVVNAVGETSVPADIATALERYTDVQVDILAWFDANPFEGEDLVDVTCLDAPNTMTGIDRRTYSEAKAHLHDYDLIQTHHNHSGAFAKIIARQLGIPSVSREGNVRRGFNRLGRIANGLTNTLAATVVCNSKAVYDSFYRWEDAILPNSKVTFIPNGVDFERVQRGRLMDWSAIEAADVDEAAFLVGTAGLLTEQKDHRTLIEAVAIARERVEVDMHLLLAGDGPLEESLREFAAECGIEHSTHFLGFLNRQQVYSLFDELDVYAMPSRWEGFSAAAVEALGSGLPAVFSSIAPFTEPYRDVARFHQVGDAEALAQHLVDFAENPNLCEQLGTKGKELVTQAYAMDTVAERYRDLYEEILTE